MTPRSPLHETIVGFDFGVMKAGMTFFAAAEGSS